MQSYWSARRLRAVNEEGGPGPGPGPSRAPAVPRPQAPPAPGSSAAAMARPLVPSSQKALLLELKGLQEEPVEGFRVTLVDEGDLYNWEVAIFGPPNTYYEGGYFKVSGGVRGQRPPPPAPRGPSPTSAPCPRPLPWWDPFSLSLLLTGFLPSPSSPRGAPHPLSLLLPGPLPSTPLPDRLWRARGPWSTPLALGVPEKRLFPLRPLHVPRGEARDPPCFSGCGAFASPSLWCPSPSSWPCPLPGADKEASPEPASTVGREGGPPPGGWLGHWLGFQQRPGWGWQPGPAWKAATLADSSGPSPLGFILSLT